MKKIFSRTNFAAIFFAVIAILCFFAPFLRLEGTISTLEVRYITGFELVFNVNIWGKNFHESLNSFQMSVTTTATLVFLVLSVVLNIAGTKRKFLSFLAVILLFAGAVMTYACAAWSTWGFQISVSAWKIFVHVGSMVSASLMVIAGFLSLANAFSKK